MNSTFERYAVSPAEFRADLLIDVSGSVRRLGDVQDQWQADDFAALDPGMMVCNGRSTAPARQRCWLERPRGHSKTSDLAVLIVWCITFATRPVRGFAYASDRDQAKLLLDAISTLCRLNPWLSSILTVEAHRVINRAAGHPGSGATLTVESSDAASSFGVLPDLIVADELCHWQGDGSLWHSILSSAAKRSNCFLAAITNAGFSTHWAWPVREAARSSEAWVFRRLDGPVASWMTPERLAEQRAMLPGIAFARLWLNQWSSGAGDALAASDIDAAFSVDLEPMDGSERDWLFCASIDLSISRDASAVVVLGIGRHGGPQQGRIRLADVEVWKPAGGSKVDLMSIENHVRLLDEQFDLEAIAADSFQAEHLIQRIEMFSQHRRRSQRRTFGREPWVRAIQPTGATLRTIATLMIECFQDRRLQCYPCEELRRDLHKLQVREMSYGVRLVSPRDETGHGDVASAFGMALLVGHGMAGAPRPVVTAFAGKRAEPRRYVPLSDDTAEFADALFRASGGARGQRFPKPPKDF